jgi:hypothetical protein
MSRASGIVPDSTAAETFWLVSFWLIITTSVATPFASPQALTVSTSMVLAASEKMSPPQ